MESLAAFDIDAYYRSKDARRVRLVHPIDVLASVVESRWSYGELSSFRSTTSLSTRTSP
jgi:hypothetical protein